MGILELELKLIVIIMVISWILIMNDISLRNDFVVINLKEYWFENKIDFLLCKYKKVKIIFFVVFLWK